MQVVKTITLALTQEEWDVLTAVANLKDLTDEQLIEDLIQRLDN